MFASIRSDYMSRCRSELLLKLKVQIKIKYSHVFSYLLVKCTTNRLPYQTSKHHCKTISQITKVLTVKHRNNHTDKRPITRQSNTQIQLLRVREDHVQNKIDSNRHSNRGVLQVTADFAKQPTLCQDKEMKSAKNP